MSDNERVVEDEVTGQRMEEVVPGSADDPLMTDAARAAQAAATPGAAPAPEAPAAPEGEGEQAPPPAPATPAPTPTAPEAAPTPAPAPVPVAPPAEAPLSEDEEGALGRLNDYLSEQRAEILREANANADRMTTKLAERHKARETELVERVRALETTGLSDEEKAALKDKYALEDERAKLESYHDELDEQHQDLLVARLSLEYSPFGVKESDLQSKTVEEMELYCAKRKADYFEEQARGGGTKPAAPAAPAPSPQAESPPSEAPASPAPAGASAPSDTGASTPTPTEPEFDKSMGREAMRKNLEALPVESVEPGKRA